MPERQPSPGLALNLPSNNPFRNRAASPALPSPLLDTGNRDSSGSRPMSRNPFLSTFEAEFNKEAAKDLDMSATMRDSPKKATFGTAAEELFNNLTLEDGDKRRAPPRPAPNRSGTEPRVGHRPTRSDEEKEKMRGQQRGPPRSRGPPSARPPRQSSTERRENRRQRRNSESSMIDKGSLDPNEERRRRERRKEREERGDRTKDGKDGKDGKSGKRVRRPQGLDLIDKLDVTGIYGPSMIHHDGPYDAVQPHRNRKKDQRAPMSAFPVGSANNSLGGSGPLNSKIDLDRIHGRGAEGFSDFGGAEQREWQKPRPEAEFSAKGREDIMHGEQTHGLGTSTFLEGAPASRKAILQDSENNQRAMVDGGLGRKKSIAQRFRGISQPRRYGDNPRITSPESRYAPGTNQNGPYSAGPLSQTKTTELNPFFNDEYDKAYEAKGATIRTNETDTRGGPSSPGRNQLTRAVTSDSFGSPPQEPKPSGGFLNRVKSLKGGRRRPA
ncbi:Pal1-domain-containing protein [Cucurbitaria berberidis CBS 394.84]|uniref:Pal1-domain-containing protein n=1 Tax=Cucurbitaria berberidis CBS 394.84 TaxID=1168544 RepID=A0A9P4GBZ0_9PLEO|nr:Pal1-domain-containing protein [Cucurbitaria berberidis CBS 394.84]KAF1843058.1 Pal1-domain-containing protein [Cucurbitaria berberidis CBS 394.84]